MTKQRRKPIVGETLYALNVYNNARNEPQRLRPAIVKSVGRKYFTLELTGSYSDTKFDIQTWREIYDCSDCWFIYETEKERQDQVDRERIISFLRSIFGFSFSNPINSDSLSLDLLLKMEDMIKKELEENKCKEQEI